jgi:hypothetical protein
VTRTAHSMALATHLDQSAATEDFRTGVGGFLREMRPNARVRYNAGCPPVKVERTLTHLLAAHPDLPVEAVEIEGRSGCEYFRGTLEVEAGGESQAFRFEWNCRWKAEEMGWTDAFGLPDQIRAARHFGHDCFRVWEEVASPVSG